MLYTHLVLMTTHEADTSISQVCRRGALTPGGKHLAPGPTAEPGLHINVGLSDARVESPTASRYYLPPLLPLQPELAVAGQLVRAAKHPFRTVTPSALGTVPAAPHCSASSQHVPVSYLPGVLSVSQLGSRSLKH